MYLAIDQHRKQLTVNLRNESGDVLLRRQVGTQWPRVRKFLADIQKQSRAEGGFVAILEVCGLNDWLIEMLKEYGCGEVILIQPEKRSKKKTDRRDKGYVIRRRSQRGRHRRTWARMQRLARRYLPRPRIVHPYPNQRFHARLKAGAV